MASDALALLPLTEEKGLPPKKARGGISQLLGIIHGMTGANDQQQIQQ
jgi:hypothetical protein